MEKSKMTVYVSKEEAERIRAVADTHNIPVARMLRRLALLVTDALEHGYAWPEVEAYIQCLYKKHLARAIHEESLNLSSIPVPDLDTSDHDHDHDSYDRRNHDHDHDSYDRRNHDHDHDHDHQYYREGTDRNKVLDDSNNSNLSFDFSDEKSKTEIRTGAPKKIFSRRKIAADASANTSADTSGPKATPEPWQALETAWLDHTGDSVPSPRFGRFRKGIQQLTRFCLDQGWSVEETVKRVLACHDWCKRDSFWTGKTLYPDALLDRILPWYRDVGMASESARHAETNQPDYAAIAAAYQRRPKRSTNGTATLDN